MHGLLYIQSEPQKCISINHSLSLLLLVGLPVVCLQYVEVDMRRRRELDRRREESEQRRLKEHQEGQRIGDSGYRYHARVPKLLRPDYVRVPTFKDKVTLSLCLSELHRISLLCF